MKTTIYYFTGTGNSLKCARDLGDKLGETQLISVSEATEKEVNPLSDNIGIVFPVYIWGIPLIISEFIKKLSRENKNKYIFAVATNGGAVSGALRVLQKRLRARGLELSAGFSLKMPSNFIGMHQSSIEEQNQIFCQAETKLNEIIEYIKTGKTGILEKGSFIEGIIKTGIIYRFASIFLHKFDKDFWVNEKCNGCGMCKKVCPVENIKLENSRPKWLHHCEQCYACVNYCPRESIQFRKMTLGKQRYKNPFVEVKDIARN